MDVHPLENGTVGVLETADLRAELVDAPGQSLVHRLELPVLSFGLRDVLGRTRNGVRTPPSLFVAGQLAGQFLGVVDVLQ